MTGLSLCATDCSVYRASPLSCPSNVLRCCRPHVNLISGSNGSGKSASLQALQCCLGVKARDTGRATKAEQFIKTGCSHAVAAVCLWNTGNDALNPGLYGSSITIERRITKSSSTFSIKDAGGRKVHYPICHLPLSINNQMLQPGLHACLQVILCILLVVRCIQPRIVSLAMSKAVAVLHIKSSHVQPCACL